MDIEANEKVYNTPFSEQLLFNMKQLNYRMNRLSEIDSTKADNQNEYLMVFDAAIVLFRAMFLESGRLNENFTLQNYYRLTGRENVSDAIDAFLDSNFDSWSGNSIRKVLKTIADKYVCHLDKIDATQLALANGFMANLSSQASENNFLNIVKKLDSIITKERA